MKRIPVNPKGKLTLESVGRIYIDDFSIYANEKRIFDQIKEMLNIKGWEDSVEFYGRIKIQIENLEDAIQIENTLTKSIINEEIEE